ncbi:Hypothetical protein A7982_10463 [Minicystis rosea]|nr:Hypothetical protein A7982_10463 [Minicystis rosea]
MTRMIGSISAARPTRSSPVRLGVAAAAFVTAALSVLPARAEPPPSNTEPPVDCTKPGPGRVPVVVAVGAEPVHLETLPHVFFDPPGSQNRKVKWGTRCLDAPDTRFTCQGSCTLYVHPGHYALSWPSVMGSYSGPLAIGAEGATLKLWQGHEPTAIAGLALAGVGALSALGTTIAIVVKNSATSWTPYVAAAIASGSTMVVGLVTAFIAMPRVSVGPRASTTATLSAAPVPGGGVVFGSFAF